MDVAGCRLIKKEFPVKLFDPSSGYRRLDSYTLATLIQMATLRFCTRFLNRSNDPCGRQYDQMTQAARSGRANIIEGSERAATSKETEMKLTDVAKASLGELRGDYEMWLLQNHRLPWPKTSPEARAVFRITLDSPDFKEDWVHESARYLFVQEEKFAPWLTSDDDCVVANALMILCSRAIHMLTRQIEAQGKAFTENGGFRERLTTCRIETLSNQAPLCPLCEKPMRKRVARQGKNAGNSFWSCSGYPDCTGTRPCE